MRGCYLLALLRSREVRQKRFVLVLAGSGLRLAKDAASREASQALFFEIWHFTKDVHERLEGVVDFVRKELEKTTAALGEVGLES